MFFINSSSLIFGLGSISSSQLVGEVHIEVGRCLIIIVAAISNSVAGRVFAALVHGLLQRGVAVAPINAVLEPLVGVLSAVRALRACGWGRGRVVNRRRVVNRGIVVRLRTRLVFGYVFHFFVQFAFVVGSFAVFQTHLTHVTRPVVS